MADTICGVPLYSIFVNHEVKIWSGDFIAGRDLKILAGAPDFWVVNRITRRGGDPEVGDDERVSLADADMPEFVVRNPRTV